MKTDDERRRQIDQLEDGLVRDYGMRFQWKTPGPPKKEASIRRITCYWWPNGNSFVIFLIGERDIAVMVEACTWSPAIADTRKFLDDYQSQVQSEIAEHEAKWAAADG